MGSVGGSSEEGLQNGHFLLFQLSHKWIVGDLQVIDLDVPAQSQGVVSYETVQQLVQLRRIGICIGGSVAVVDEYPQHLEILRV